MKQPASQSLARDAVLDAAEQLFVDRGYAAVTLKDIAKQLDIKQASLYYHVPGGKEDLFVEVMLRHLERRRHTLEQIISTGSPGLEDCLMRVGMWLIFQPPLNAGRMVRTDLPDLAPEHADQLEAAMGRCSFAPMEAVFAQHRERLNGDPGFIAGTFMAAIEALSVVKRYGIKTEQQLIADLIALLLRGALLG
jgi:AcrR family transcriptional regulator